MTLEEVVDQLYELRPDEFVPARDDAVAEAKAAGDKDLAKAIARLRRPTKAAWLANLLARKRGEQLDGLLALGGDLAEAQRHLDGPQLRALSAQRNRLVAAMAREAGRLAYEAGDRAGESVLRELQDILHAALADPTVADEVRSGQLTRTIAYSGFGPVGQPDVTPTRATRPTPRTPEPGPEPEPEEDPAERERRERELAERRRAVEEAEEAEAAAAARRDEDTAAMQDAESAHAAAQEVVADLVRELEAAREREREAAAAARAAAARAKESARAAEAAAARAERARAELAELEP
ncbi:hypothetical protein SAMN05443637_109161 [Pseudonocardia thermophila]|uniref:Uncharacterized protein n=1 Tax=Pseudonocardia thermophila TaxID=1848 RepID=A0A1M6U6D7_PSETH|nr:hypothetical protein [Pseudonocardia thermophila]SHK64711.1 hypothetical protein SAMN05443637_109161 [Pseudonocardia thermophila]